MKQSVWEEDEQKDVDRKDMELHNRTKEEIYTKERESLSLVQRRKEGSKEIHSKANKEKIYLIIKVTTDGTGIFCRKEEQKEENNTRLLVF